MCAHAVLATRVVRTLHDGRVDVSRRETGCMRGDAEVAWQRAVWTPDDDETLYLMMKTLMNTK
jgi:hypothetical protein